VSVGGFVQIPRDLIVCDLPGVNDTARVFWAVLARRTRPSRDPKVWALQHTLMGDLGRSTAARTATLTRAAGALTRAGWLLVERTHSNGKTHNTYRVLGRCYSGDRRPYVELPDVVLDRLAGGELSQPDVIGYARWADSCGRSGWTNASAGQVARTYRVSVRTMKASRSSLIASGLLLSRETPGRPTLTAVPGHLPAGVPVQILRDHPCKNRVITRANFEGSPVQILRDRSTSLQVPKDEAPAVAPSGDTRHLPDARETATAAAPTPTTIPTIGQAQKRVAAGELLAVLPSISHAAPQWRRSLIATLDRAMDKGYGPGAIAGAVEMIGRYDDTRGREIPTLRAALRNLAGDVKGGTICRWCGQAPDRPRRRICPTCNPDLPMTPDDLAALDELRQALGPLATVTELGPHLTPSGDRS
jgi:hypothetical protein